MIIFYESRHKYSFTLMALLIAVTIGGGSILNVVKSKANGDELSFLSESFNSMVTAIKS
jgi:hypothetical protein